jgi:hypothetical protein
MGSGARNAEGRGSHLFWIAIEADQVGQDVHFAAEGTHVLADEIEPDPARASGGQVQGDQDTVIEVGFDAVLRQPAEAEAASDGVDGCLDGRDLENALGGNPRLMFEGSGCGALDCHKRVPHQVRTIELALDSEERVILACDCDHPDVEDGPYEEISGDKARDAELGAVDGEFGIGSKERALTEFRLNVGKAAGELRQSGKEEAARIDAVHREPHLGFASRGQRMRALLDLVKTGEMCFDFGKHDAAEFGQMRAPALHLKELDAEPLLQATDGVADRRLGAIELFGRRRKATQLDNRLQDLPFVEGSPHTRSIISRNSIFWPE